MIVTVVVGFSDTSAKNYKKITAGIKNIRGVRGEGWKLPTEMLTALFQARFERATPVNAATLLINDN